MTRRLCLVSGLLLAACAGSPEKSPPPALPPPVLLSVSPPQLDLGGGAVVIGGTGFQDGATVSVGGTPATGVTYVSGTQLLVGAPARASGSADVVVANPDGQQATLVAGLTYAPPPAAPPPALTSLAPTGATTAGGVEVTILGADLSPLATATFGGLPAERLSGTSTALVVRVPAHGAGTVDVVVANPDGQSATLATAFTFSAPQQAAPVAQGLSPASGPASGGTVVTITGTDFSAPQVSFGGTTVAATSSSATSITVTAPVHAPGTVDVVVRNGDGQASTLAAAFSFTGGPPPPAIAGVSPSSGSTAGGGLTTLTGSGFVSGSTVTFGGTAVPLAVPATATSLAVYAPAHAAGPVDVTVTNPDAQSTTASAAYTYVAPPPLVLALSVRGGPLAGGTQVLAVGSDFVAGVSVTVDGLPATGETIVNLGVGTSAVSFFTPAHAEGFAAVVVTNPDGQSSSPRTFHYGPPPQVTAVACAGGCDRVRRDDLVTLTGSAFTTGPGEGVQVSFNSADRPQKAVAVQVSASSTEIVVQAPKLDPGLYTLVVSNFDGQFTVPSQQLRYPAP